MDFHSEVTLGIDPPGPGLSSPGYRALQGTVVDTRRLRPRRTGARPTTDPRDAGRGPTRPGSPAGAGSGLGRPRGTDPIRALESFVLGWFPAEEAESAGKESTAGEPGDLPEALAAFHRLARLRPAVHRFRNPVLKQPRRDSGPLGGRPVFAVDGEETRDWSIPWPPRELSEVDPRVWLTEDPFLADPETILEEEPLSRFLLQYTLYEAMNAALHQAWTYSACRPRASPRCGACCAPCP